MKSGISVYGKWEAKCYKPIIINDVEKARDILGSHADLIINNCITYKTYLENRQVFKKVENLFLPQEIGWSVEWTNRIVNVGLNYLLDVSLVGGTQLSSWYLGLINGASPTIAAADTMSSHSGWTENTNYDEATRRAWTPGAVASQSVSNSASPAVFTISTNGQTLGGAFLVSNSTKGGTTGTLYAAGTFSSSKNADDNDTLTLTATFGSADDGV